MAKRFVRLHGTPLEDNRTAPQIDRDRIMYTSAFRRLASVTQVVSADEVHVFHNRLTHSLQVAQVARRSAEFLIKQEPRVKSFIDPDVCEAAALAHDIGHPPFGHLAEETLDRLAVNHGLDDGFEGNAQSFRIVTKLAANDATCEGLDLTRATLNALLKYPWLRGENRKKPDKWGAYASEKDAFRWARKLAAPRSQDQCPEARIMDWADDVTYSVHDVEDFYKAGLIPLDRLSSSRDERQSFYIEVFKRNKGKLPASEAKLEETFERTAELWTEFSPYTGRFLQRQTLKSVASRLIGDFVQSIGVSLISGGCDIRLDETRRNEVFLLKQLTWHYVILNPALTTQQSGQRRVITGLFNIYLEAIQEENFRLFPTIYREKLTEQASAGEPRAQLIRTMIDMIAGMTEIQAVHLFHRLTGTALGSALNSPLG